MRPLFHVLIVYSHPLLQGQLLTRSATYQVSYLPGHLCPRLATYRACYLQSQLLTKPTTYKASYLQSQLLTRPATKRSLYRGRCKVFRLQYRPKGRDNSFRAVALLAQLLYSRSYLSALSCVFWAAWRTRSESDISVMRSFSSVP